MTDNKMIIEALDQLSEKAHNYVDRKNAEIQALTIRNATLEATIERLENENMLLQGEVSDAHSEVERLNKEVDRLSLIVFYHDGHIADAIKDFVHEIFSPFEGQKYLSKKDLEMIVNNLAEYA